MWVCSAPCSIQSNAAKIWRPHWLVLSWLSCFLAFTSTVLNVVQIKWSFLCWASSPGVHPDNYHALWFQKIHDSASGETLHVYKGGYWEAKEQGVWDMCPDIYWVGVWDSRTRVCGGSWVAPHGFILQLASWVRSKIQTTFTNPCENLKCEKSAFMVHKAAILA